MGDIGAGAAAPLTYELTEASDGSALVILGGDLDTATAGELEASVEPVIQRSPARLVVDVSSLRFADSSAIALFVRWANLVGQVEIREPSALLRRVIERMGLGERLRMKP